jgi:hypothetical protein
MLRQERLEQRLQGKHVTETQSSLLLRAAHSSACATRKAYAGRPARPSLRHVLANVRAAQASARHRTTLVRGIAGKRKLCELFKRFV